MKEMRCQPPSQGMTSRWNEELKPSSELALTVRTAAKGVSKKLHGDVIIAVLLQADLPHFNRRNDVYRLLLTCMDLMHMAESGSGKALTV